MSNVCSDLEGYGSLQELALDMHWSWSHSADKVWSILDPVLWERTNNPWIILQTISRETLEKNWADPAFRKLVDELLANQRRYEQTETWFKTNHSQGPLSCVVYFSMEYMLSEALPIYSGGLGNVAGDQLKSASDLGIPVIAIGLLYQQGYFRQVINKDGGQEALYPYNDPGQLPITPLRKSNGEWLRIEVTFPGWSLWIRIWQVKVGRVLLYLLDTNDAANPPVYRAITSELYGGGPELRLKQEVLLGIGGWRLVEALQLKPQVCHLNEGHAAFAILERTRHFMLENGVNFETALEITRSGTLFTTHTAVPAGFDRFDPNLIVPYLKDYLGQLGISPKDFLALGRANPDDPNEPFNMAYLAVKGCGAINGVSQLHGKVSQNIFSSLFPRWPVNEVPVGYVTNGVHAPSWDSPDSDELWTEVIGKDRWRWALDFIGDDVEKVPNARLWQMRYKGRKALVEFARRRLSYQLAARGSPPEEVEMAKHLFDENILTLGFARRFATYKRPNMLLHDPERLIKILTNSHCPVQLVIAGKAHPADQPGQALIQQWMNFIQNPVVRAHVIFLSDYDMLITEKMVQGVDVWVNTPRRPWEACGTSGMKVLANGGINLSELDGWWAEAYSPEVGWAIGDGKEHGADPAWDAAEANTLYDILEKEVVPNFYDRDDEGIPQGWVKKMRGSICLTPHFSANRTVREYTEHYYVPLAKNYSKRAADKGAEGTKIMQWKNTILHNWSKIHFGQLKVNTPGNQHQFEIDIYLNGVDPANVKVEIYAEETGNEPYLHEMTRLRELTGNPNTFRYTVTVPANIPASAYTTRIIPHFPDVAVPLEQNAILWQK